MGKKNPHLYQIQPCHFMEKLDPVGISPRCSSRLSWRGQIKYQENFSTEKVLSGTGAGGIPIPGIGQDVALGDRAKVWARF